MDFYGILPGELAAVGAGTPGVRAQDMLSFDRPGLGRTGLLWSGLARGMGVNAVRAGELESLAKALGRSYYMPGGSPRRSRHPLHTRGR